MTSRITSALAASAAAALLCLAPSAGAATLDRAPDGTLVYQGGAQGTNLSLQAGYDGTSAVFYGASTDVVTSYPADCTAHTTGR